MAQLAPPHVSKIYKVQILALQYNYQIIEGKKKKQKFKK